MDTKQSVRLLRMAFHLLRIDPYDTSSIGYSVGRDLYDFVEEYTTDKNIKLQMQSARATGMDRLKIIRYLKHRLNIDIS